MNEIWIAIKEVHSFVFPPMLIIFLVGIISWLMGEYSPWFFLLLVPLIYSVLVYISLGNKKMEKGE